MSNYRVVLIQETGEECYVGSIQTSIEDAEIVAAQAREDYPECRGVYVEPCDYLEFDDEWYP